MTAQGPLTTIILFWEQGTIFNLIHKSIFLSALVFVLSGCGKVPFDAIATYDLDSLGIPRFINNDFTDLNKVKSISKFRSSQGHDYPDDFESNRSMKHYFNPKPEYANAKDVIECFSPVDGRIISTHDEYPAVSGEARGREVQIRPFDYPGFIVIMFHVNTALERGASVSAGQKIGYFDTRAGTNFDIAVHCATFMGDRILSYFDVMTDSVFALYAARGVSSREAMIISKEYRDAHPADFSHPDDSEIVQLN